MTWTYWTYALFISDWLIRLSMLYFVPHRRKPVNSMAWLIVILIFPWPGLILYWLFGRYRIPKRRTKKHARMMKHLSKHASRKKNRLPRAQPRLGKAAITAVNLAERLGDLPIVAGNAVEMIAQTESTISKLIKDIDEAKYHVHLLFYIFSDDETGQRVINALMRARERQVTCRVLVDAVGSRTLYNNLAVDMRAHGIEIQEMLPVGLFRRRVARIDMRNHRKLVIIDGKIGYTGSQNIVDPNYGHKKMAWRDLMMRLTGPVVMELQSVFLSDWRFETDEDLDGDDLFPEPVLSGDIAVQTLPSGPNYPTENYQRLVVAAIHTAQEHVIITTPYFIPDDAFLQAMQTACLRGVKVELIVPAKSDMKLVDMATHAYFDDLLDAGVIVHCYNNGLLHAKTMSIDHAIAFVGSSNFDIRSFALNFEINMLLYGRDVTDKLRWQQKIYINDSTRITQENWIARPEYIQFAQNIAKLLSPLL